MAATERTTSTRSSSSPMMIKKKSLKPSLEDFSSSLRPMIMLNALLDVLSEQFVLNMQDTEIEASATRIVEVLQQCQHSKGLRELLKISQVTSLSDDDILEEFQAGMMAAYNLLWSSRDNQCGRPRRTESQDSFSIQRMD